MRHLRFAAIALALFAVAGTAFAGSASHSPNAPKNLHGFLLRSNEPTTNEFPRTPAFAWSPVNGALCYEFELGTSKSFTLGSSRRHRERDTPSLLPEHQGRWQTLSVVPRARDYGRSSGARFVTSKSQARPCLPR